MITGILVGLTTVALLIASAHSDRQKRNAIRETAGYIDHPYRTQGGIQ